MNSLQNTTEAEKKNPVVGILEEGCSDATAGKTQYKKLKGIIRQATELLSC